MTCDEKPKKLCPHCPGEYSVLCERHKEVCECHLQEEFDDKKSLRHGMLQECEYDEEDEDCDKRVM